MKKYIQFLSLFPLLTLLACGQGKTTQSQIVVSLSALTAGTSFPGGGMLRIKNILSGKILDFDLTTSNTVALPHGSWDMFFVGFQGASAWTGPHLCGGVSNIELNQDAQTVEISANSTDCATEPYLAMINSKSVTGIWDQNLWDQTKWGP